MALKKGQHSDQWPWPVEIQHKQEVIHASISSEGDQRVLVDAVDHAEGTSRALRIPHIPVSKALSRADSAQIFRTAYPTRRSTVNIQRPHHWGFKSLRPAPPLKTQQLIGLRERDKSPKAAKKFNYPNVKKKRASKHMEELLSMAGNMKVPIENKPGDNAILRVIEAYCAGGRGGAIHSDQPVTYINRSRKTSHPDKSSSRSHTISAAIMTVDENDEMLKEHRSKSTTLPPYRRGMISPKHLSKPQNHDLPGFPYRPPSPILLSDQGAALHGSWGQSQASSNFKSATSTKRSLFRRRAESVDNSRIRNT